ncbi:MAG: hypothetical protein ROZ37_04225 [Aromatoleum sp.]|uniref:hypothetical protein n=1 Tax=Aromatoleum sp. TaxID=2307007 RepID=UPI002893848A|nr:hypothetical protein [Aromatoleum sp.]MDT3669526.1 hypothetical protein [Aromatoleum sp.]
MCEPVSLAVLAAASVAQAVQARSTAKDQRSAQKKAERSALAQQQQAEREFRMQDKKRPDISGLLGANAAAAGGGVGSTMLTGPSGIDSSSLSLGKNTLLGS